MALPSIIRDPKTGREVKVTKSNALAISPPSPSKAYNATLDVDDTATQIVSGVGGQTFCITGIILTGTKDISTTVDATVNIFEATADDLTTSLAAIFDIPVARSSQAIITNLLIEVEEGRFIMGKTSDDDVFVTILGFYV